MLFVCLTCWVAKSHYCRIIPFFTEILTWTLQNPLVSESEIRLVSVHFAHELTEATEASAPPLYLLGWVQEKTE